jgi:hypothetical protein
LVQIDLALSAMLVMSTDIKKKKTKKKKKKKKSAGKKIKSHFLKKKCRPLELPPPSVGNSWMFPW